MEYAAIQNHYEGENGFCVSVQGINTHFSNNTTGGGNSQLLKRELFFNAAWETTADFFRLYVSGQFYGLWIIKRNQFAENDDIMHTRMRVGTFGVLGIQDPNLTQKVLNNITYLEIAEQLTRIIIITSFVWTKKNGQNVYIYSSIILNNSRSCFRMTLTF